MAKRIIVKRNIVLSFIKVPFLTLYAIIACIMMFIIWLRQIVGQWQFPANLSMPANLFKQAPKKRVERIGGALHTPHIQQVLSE